MRLTAIDLTRFAAALSVVMYHYTAREGSHSFGLLSHITRFGYLGVPLFFMISGYVITLSANNRTAFQFAISRFFRLYPTFWAAIAFTVMVAILFGNSKYSMSQILSNLTMLNDYLGYRDIDGVYWTLQAELKFYACVFLLLAFGIFEKPRIWLSIWLALTAFHAMFNQPFFLGWFISPAYSSFFIAGVSFYLIQKEGLNRFNVVILISSLLLSSVLGFSQISGFIRNPSVGSQIISVIVIWGFYLLFFQLVTNRIRLRNDNYYVVLLGSLTYPLYLIHNVAGEIIIQRSLAYLSVAMATTMTIIAMLVFSYLIHVGIEIKLATPIKRKLLARTTEG